MKSDLKKLILSHDEISSEIEKKYNLDSYIDKLSEFATIIPYFNGNLLKGFIAYYSNDISKTDAFLTIIITDKESKGEGIGRLLLQSSISDLTYRGFTNYRLEVLKGNERAIALYQKFGFQIEKDNGYSYVMNLNLKKQC